MDSAKAIGYMRGDASMMGSYINRIKSLGWTRGQPDLCVVKPSGDVFFIEFKKTSKTKLSEDQEEVHDSLKLRQVQVYVVSSIDDLDFLLDD
jgi:hypothetical protein